VKKKLDFWFLLINMILLNKLLLNKLLLNLIFMVRIGLSDWSSHNYEKFAIWMPKKEEKQEISKEEVKNTSQTAWDLQIYIPEKHDTILETQNKKQELHNSIETDFENRNVKQLGVINKTIKDLQTSLNQKLKTNLKEDNIFWRKTIEALIRFQKENKLLPTWICDKETQAILFGVQENKKNQIEEVASRQKISKNEIKKSISNSKNTYSCTSLSDFIVKKRYKAKGRNACGASVWDALVAFWVKWLPENWRDWHKWDDFLENRPDFIKVRISDPREANPGAILVYNKWYWSWARRDYGHVEIVTKDWFYYWKFKDIPGWSAKDGFTGYAYYYVWNNPSNNIW